MVRPGCTWLDLDIPGYTSSSGYTRLHLVTPAYTWLHQSTPRYTRLHLVTPVYTSLHLSTPGHTRYLSLKLLFCCWSAWLVSLLCCWSAWLVSLLCCWSDWLVLLLYCWSDWLVSLLCCGHDWVVWWLYWRRDWLVWFPCCWSDWLVPQLPGHILTSLLSPETQHSNTLQTAKLDLPSFPAANQGPYLCVVERFPPHVTSDPGTGLAITSSHASHLGIQTTLYPVSTKNSTYLQVF